MPLRSAAARATVPQSLAPEKRLVLCWPRSAAATLDASEKEKLDLLRVDQTFEDTRAEMKRLKLDRGKAAYRRPLDLLEEAYLAIRYPVAAQGRASSVLLTLRGSINRSIDELVRRRPVQEAAVNREDRVLSIGRHCGKSGLARAHFYSLAAEDEFVNIELSDKGEKAGMERPDLVKQFLRGAQYLRALLTSVDEAPLLP